MDTFEQSTLVPNPLVKRYRSFTLYLGVLAVLTLILAIFIGTASFTGGNPRSIVSGPLIAFPLLLIGMVTTALLYRQWKQIDRQRLAAFEGTRALLAEKQPAPNATLLALPAVFKMQASTIQIVFLAIFTELVFALFCFCSWLSDPRLPLWLFLIFGVLILGLVAYYAFKSKVVLEATEEGLKVTASSDPKLNGMVPWNEADIFVVYNAPGLLQSQDTLTYELSSDLSVVRWTHITGPGVLGLHMDPGMPLAEHNQRMQELYEVIVARTGLPLYDLRKKLPSKVREGVTAPQSEQPFAQ